MAGIRNSLMWLVRKPQFHVGGLTAGALVLAIVGVSLDFESFGVELLAWGATLFLTLAVGSVAVPWYRARRRDLDRRAALAAQYRLLTKLGMQLADELSERYSLDRYVVYPFPPDGPTSRDDFGYYYKQHHLRDKIFDDQVERLVHQSRQAKRRTRSFDALKNYGANRSSYWLAEAVLHLRRCPVRDSFPFLMSLDSSRLDRIRELAAGEEPVDAATSAVARCLDRIALARDRALAANLVDRRWLKGEFEVWLQSSRGAPFPLEFRRWMAELDAIGDLSLEFARLVQLIGDEANLRSDNEPISDLAFDVHMVFQSSPGQSHEESELGEGWLRLEPEHFLPTYEPSASAYARAWEAMERGEYEEAHDWALRSLDAGEAGSLLLLGILAWSLEDTDEATTWMLQAHASGDPHAAYHLSLRMWEARLLPDALVWLELAADKDPASDACCLAAEIEELRGNDRAVLSWRERGAAAGNLNCLVALAEHAQATSEMQRAWDLRRRAARNGSMVAMVSLVAMIEGGWSGTVEGELEFWKSMISELTRNPQDDGESIAISAPGDDTPKGAIARGWMLHEPGSDPVFDAVLRHVVQLVREEEH